MIGTAVIVLPAFASSEHDPSIVAGHRLARLNIHVIAVQRDLARDGDYVECKEAPLARDESRWKWRDKQDDRDAPGL